MKTKKKKLSVHDKVVDIMNRETNRAIAHVEFLEKLYREMVESKKKENK